VLDKALDEIRWKVGRVQKLSSLYETAAWGFVSEEDFLNRVAVVETKLTAVEVLKNILETTLLYFLFITARLPTYLGFHI